jgi:hypothetical protein
LIRKPFITKKLTFDGAGCRAPKEASTVLSSDFRDQIRHPNLKRLYDYWNSRRKGDLYPSRADIDPVEFAFALGNVTLVDVLYDPLRFRFRLMGTLMAQRTGQDLTGRMVDEVENPGYRDVLLQAYRTTIETGRPNTIIHEQTIQGKVYEFEVLRLPLAEDGRKINMLLLCPMYFEQVPSWPPTKMPPPGTFSLPRPPEKRGPGGKPLPTRTRRG